MIDRLPIGLIIWDLGFKVRLWNAAAEKIFGYSPEEAVGRHAYDLIVPGERRSHVYKVWERLIRGDMAAHSVNENITKEGKVILCRWTNTPLFSSEGEVMGVLSLCEDMTRLRLAQATVSRLHILQGIITSINQLLLTAEEETGLLKGVCDLLVRYERIRFAWIGMVEPESHEIRPVAWAGQGNGPPSAIRVTIDGSQIGEAIKGDKPFICNIETHPTFFPWRDEALRRGYASALVIPLALGPEHTGILAIYSGSKDAFSDEETAFLVEVAGDIAIGLKGLRLERQLKDSLEKLQKALNAIVTSVARLCELRDPYTAGHQSRVAQLSRAIAQELGLPEEMCHGVYIAGLVHDIGKIAVPMDILAKPGRLSEYEFNIIKTHTTTGFDLLKDVELPWPVAEVALQHHERIDGSGYPQGLKGDATILEARVLAVADVVEAMSSHRPYRPALGIEKALEEIQSHRGKLYDPDVVDACLRVFQKGFTFNG